MRIAVSQPVAGADPHRRDMVASEVFAPDGRSVVDADVRSGLGIADHRARSSALADFTRLRDDHRVVEPGAADFDAMYAESIASPHDGVEAQLLDLPTGVRSNSSLTGQGLDDVVEQLGVAAGELVVDLGCGRGHLGLEIRRRTGCRLLGLDLSPVAIGAARAHAADRGESGPDVRFVTGDMTDLDLPDRCAAAVVSIDAIYFGKPLAASVAQSMRVLRPGGRLVATGWEPAHRDAGAPGRLEAALTACGYRAVRAQPRPDWYAREKQKWLAVAAMPNDGDALLTSVQREARAVLGIWDERERVLVTAERP